MPIDPKVKTLVHRALDNRILSVRESDRIINYLENNAVSPATVNHVLTALKDALAGDQLDLSTRRRNNTLHDFLGQLNSLYRLGLSTDGATRPDGSVDWVGALQLGIAGGTVGDQLEKKSFSGERISVDKQGNLALSGQLVHLDFAKADGRQLSALLGLVRAEQLDGLGADKAAALTDGLLAQLKACFPVDVDSKGKLYTIGSASAALGALATLGPKLDSKQADALLGLYDAAPGPLQQCLILRALERTTLSSSQATSLAALAVPDAKDVLLATFDRVTAGSYTVRGTPMDGATTELAFAIVSFARDQNAVLNCFDALEHYRHLNSGAEWDDEARGHAERFFAEYLDAYPQTSFLFGTLAQSADKEIAGLTNARIKKSLKADLAKTPASFGGVPLSPSQVPVVERLLAGVRNAQAVERLAQAMAYCGDIVSTQDRSSFMPPPAPRAPLSNTAFAAFERLATKFLEQQDSTPDGMIATTELLREARTESQELKRVVAPALRSLAADPASFVGIPVSADGARLLRRLLREDVRSAMSIENLKVGMQVVADANGGRIEGPGYTQMETLIREYKSNWPNLTTFDFNKLSRMANFVVQGLDIPLSTLNGKSINLADFYVEVAKSVAASVVQTGSIAYAWMPERWGYRARQSVELLDVIAQQTAEGTGPVKLLSQQFPGKAVTVEVTGASGAHEEFVFRVEGEGRFNQASDGTLQAYRGRAKPVLFTSVIRDDGAFDVSVAQRIETNSWPLQAAYSVGDSIDMGYRDPEAADRRVEGEAFSTSHKILEAHITGYTADGRYTVKYTKPDGKEVEAVLTLAQIERDNNPHHFSLTGSNFIEVHINRNTQPALAAFLDGAKPIIEKHLPVGGALLSMSPDELAKAQRACVNELMAYTRKAMTYPRDKDASPDENSKKYHDIIDNLPFWQKAPLGDLVEIQRGVCRHQCILQQLVMQMAGIDSRLAEGAANTSAGMYRGLHIWVELSTADGGRYLSDQTWNDVAIPLWDGAYDRDKRRKEIYYRTAAYDRQIVS